MYGMYSFKPCLALFLLLLSTQKGLSADFYVGPAVVDEVFPDDDPNWGISEALPFETISYALTRIQGGDTLWIKTHTYTEQIDLNVLSSGLGGTAEPPSEAAPILIKGYETSTGDLDSGGGIPSAYGIGAISTMPSVSGNNNGFGVRLRGHDYVTIMNLRVAGFRHGLYSVDSNHCIIKHVLCEDIGDAASNDGNGIRLKGNASNQNLIDKCYVLNAPYIGIYIQDGDNNRVENCQVYADDDTDSRETDYFICVSSSYNIVKLCRTKMIANGGVGLSGGSHGIVLQGRSVHAETAHDNTVINCHMTNHHDQLLFRGTNCYENDVIDCHLMKEDTNLTSRGNSREETPDTLLL